MHLDQYVASFTGAWIETISAPSALVVTKVASFTGAWIETYVLVRDWYSFLVASFTGAWIETRCRSICRKSNSSRILYGCDTFLFQSVQIIIVSIYLVSSFHY